MCRNILWLLVLMLFTFNVKIVYSDNNLIGTGDDVKNQNLQNNVSMQNENINNNVSIKNGEYGNNNKIITFQIDEALNIDFNDIHIDDGIKLLHSDNEEQALYLRFIKQNIRVDKNKTISGEQDEDGEYIKEKILKLSSLYYYNNNNWGCKINNKFIKKNNQNEAHHNVSIVKVNKDNVLFVLNRTKKEDLEKVRELKKANYKYNNNYYIVKNGAVQSVMFRLHIGQSINLKNFKIS